MFVGRQRLQGGVAGSNSSYMSLTTSHDDDDDAVFSFFDGRRVGALMGSFNGQELCS
jgi:hypothetical protein